MILHFPTGASRHPSAKVVEGASLGGLHLASSSGTSSGTRLTLGWKTLRYTLGGELTGQIGPLIWTPTMPMQRRSTLVGEAFRGHTGARVLNVRPPRNFVVLPHPWIKKKEKEIKPSLRRSRAFGLENGDGGGDGGGGGNGNGVSALYVFFSYEPPSRVTPNTKAQPGFLYV